MAEVTRWASPSIVPERCYRDARAAMTFLERAFDLRAALVVADPHTDAIVHAELWSGHACIMLASVSNHGPWAYRVPAEIGGVNTGSLYLATDDVDAHYARAVAAGCTIVNELAPTGYGSRDYSALDHQGFLWSVGTYRPGAEDATPPSTETEVFAGMRYADARAAIGWLGRAFGAVEQFVVPGEGDDVAHAQLLIGAGLVMLGSARSDAFNLRTPEHIGGDYTQTLNVTIDDPDAHCARALAAGASIITPPADTAYGARAYVARDCEGYVWSFGTYRPVTPTPPDGTMSRASMSRI